MSPILQGALWGLVALVPLALNFRALKTDYREHVDAVGLSLMLVILWALSNIIAMSPPGPPQNMIPLTAIDLIATAICAAAWLTQRRAYKMALAGLFVFELWQHAAFWNAWPSPGILYNYKASLNAAFALQLLVTGWPGGVVLVRDALSWLSHRRAFHPFVDAGHR